MASYSTREEKPIVIVYDADQRNARCIAENLTRREGAAPALRRHITARVTSALEMLVDWVVTQPVYLVVLSLPQPAAETDSGFVKELESAIQVIGEQKESKLFRVLALYADEAPRIALQQFCGENQLSQFLPINDYPVDIKSPQPWENWLYAQGIDVISAKPIEAADLAMKVNLLLELSLLDVSAHLKNYALGHDIAQPVTAVMGLVDLIQLNLQNLDEETRELFLLLESSADRAREIVQTFWQRDQLSLGRTKMNTKSIAARVLMHKVKSRFETTAVQRGVVLAMDHNTVEAHLRGNPILLNHVLDNLISNAIKFTPERRQVTLAVTLSRNLQMVVLSVRDQGLGIPSDELPKLFRHDTKISVKALDHSEQHHYGLPIAKHYVEVMGGFIEVESEVGSGSAFNVYLPRVPEVRGIEI